MGKITILIVTKEWMQGEYCGFRLWMRDGCTASIDWGDGKIEKSRTGKEWMDYWHIYEEKNVTHCSDN